MTDNSINEDTLGTVQGELFTEPEVWSKKREVREEPELAVCLEVIAKESNLQAASSVEQFRPIVQDVYQRSHAEKARHVVALADGAPWIWNIFDEVVPEATQILDYAHMKQYLYEAGKLIYLPGSDLIKPWIHQQEELLFEDKVQEVIDSMKRFVDFAPGLEKIAAYFETNRNRMRYGSFKKAGFHIGSGSIESAGKRIAQGRIKGAGMRWNIKDLNPIIKMRCSLIERSWDMLWPEKLKIAA